MTTSNDKFRPGGTRRGPRGGMTRRELLAVSAAAGALSFAPARVRAQGGTPPSSPTGQVIAGLSQEPTNFHPLMPHIEVDQGVYWNLFSPLWGVDEEGNFVPHLVAEVPTLENGGISEDGLTWRVRLRDDVKWHDGTPFTSEDVKFTFELIQNPDFRAISRAGHELVRDIEVISPTEMTWRLEEPYAPYPSVLAWTFMVPKHLLEGMPLDAPEFRQSPVGTGPFKWVERVSGDHILLEANPDYFGDGPYLERLVFKYIPDLTVLYTQFQTGDIDYIGLQGITADHYNEAKDLPDRNVYVVPAPFIESIACNLGRPHFQDRAVREALYLAMDKEGVVDAIYYGLPRPTESYLPSEAWAHNGDLPKHSYDPDKARAILDEAGWTPGADGVREKDGVRLSFENSTTAGNQVREQAQQLLQQNWKEIGVEMNIRNHPPAVMWGDNWMMSQFDSAMVGLNFMTGADPDATQYLHSSAIGAKTGSGQNTTQYSNPEVDRLLEEGATVVDPEQRKEIYHKVQEILRQDLPFLYLFQYAQVEGTKAGLAGYSFNVNVQSNCWNASTWFWET